MQKSHDTTKLSSSSVAYPSLPLIVTGEQVFTQLLNFCNFISNYDYDKKPRKFYSV